MTPNMTYGSPMPAKSLTVAYTGTAGTTAAIDPAATTIRVMVTTDAFVEITTAGTAAVANTGLYMVAYVPEYFSAPQQAKVSAIQVASGGTLYVTPFC